MTPTSKQLLDIVRTTKNPELMAKMSHLLILTVQMQELWQDIMDDLKKCNVI